MNKTAKKREIIFVVIGILLLAVIVGIFIYSINFLLDNIRIALDQSVVITQTITKFNLEGLKELKLIK